MAYKHRIEVKEGRETRQAAVESVAGLQVIVGAAPINQLAKPAEAVNVPIRVRSMDEAKELIGYSEDWDSFPICANMYASFEEFGLDNVIYINVLDPAKHKKSNTEEEVTVTNKQAVYKKPLVINGTITVKNLESTLNEGTDYLLAYDNDGYVVITILGTGSAAEAVSVKVTSESLDPTMVEASDIVGGYDPSTGIATGLSAVRNVYFKTGLVPAIIAAPGFSQEEEVAAALQAAIYEINAVYNAIALIDLDASDCKSYWTVAEKKEAFGAVDKNAVILWPKALMQGKTVWYSAIWGAAASYSITQHDNIPSKSPSNEALPIEGMVNGDGTEVLLDYAEAEQVNSAGVVTAINYGGWTSWGNNTACFPEDNTVANKYICNRLMANWYTAHFVQQYKKYIDDPNNQRQIENLVDSENLYLNSLTTSNAIAGGRIEYVPGTEEDVLTGNNEFRITMAFWTPQEYILGTMVISEEMLIQALTEAAGGEE